MPSPGLVPQLDATLDTAVRDIIGAHGVPTGVEGCRAVALDLHPFVAEGSVREYARTVTELRAQSPKITVPRFPPRVSTVSLMWDVRESVGLGRRANTVETVKLDAESMMIRRSRVVAHLNAEDDSVVAMVGRRITRAAMRHVADGGRRTVLTASRMNVLRWRRVLSGAEDCDFCSMLAGRGYVYSSETVQFHSHNGCDCTAEMETPR